jgi:hypothetical protein
MIDLPLIALAAAWRVSALAVSILTAALAIAPYWDKSIYLKALREALRSVPM